MKNLGNIIILILISFGTLNASVRAELTRDNINMGDTVILRLHVDGNNIKEPSISQICNTKVLSTAQSTNMEFINGNYTKEQMFSYSFAPTASCTIEPITVNIDGRDEKTQALSLHVGQARITKNTPFILSMESEKQSVYVGEAFKVKIKIKQKNNAQAIDSKFAPPELKNFWIKTQKQGNRYREGNYIVTDVDYIVAAQKSGTLHIGRAKLQIANRTHSRDPWGSFFPQLQWRNYFSNELDIDVKPLPQGVNLVGDFQISASLDKNESAPNDAVNLTLKITGNGNFEDIGSLKPFVDGVNIFEEDATTNSQLLNGKYVAIWQQKMAFVSEHDYTIPPIELKYFNPQTKNIVTISTKPLHVKIKGKSAKKEKALKIQRSVDENEIPKVQTAQESVGSQPAYLWIVALVAGIIIGVLIMLVPWRRLRKDDDSALHVSIRDEKSVLNFLLNHMQDRDVAEMVKLLEAKIYEGKSVVIDKKELKSLLKRYK